MRGGVSDNNTDHIKAWPTMWRVLEQRFLVSSVSTLGRNSQDIVYHTETLLSHCCGCPINVSYPKRSLDPIEDAQNKQKLARKLVTIQVGPKFQF